MQRRRLHKEATLRDATGREAVDLVANPLRRPRLRVRDRLGHVVAVAAAAAVSGVRQQTIPEVSIAADGEAPAYYSYNNLAYLNADQNLGSLVHVSNVLLPVVGPK